MKKIVTIVIALLVCLTAAFAGCGDSTGYSNKLTGFDGEVSSNGGFAVVKGDYVYFINGVATKDEDNTYGKVTTGALVRIKTADLLTKEATASEEQPELSGKGKTPELVIPSLFVAGDKTSGFYIFGNDVYYATPVNTKNKEGVVEKDKLNFVKTSLDGSVSVILKTVKDNTTNYRYVEKDGKVYLITKTVNDKDEAVINIINATDNKEVITTEKIDSYIFCDSEKSGEVFYTKLSYNENLKEDEKFNEIHRVTVDGKDEVVFVGMDMMSDVENGYGVMGVKFSFVKNTLDTLYVKVEYVDTSITTVVNYYAIDKASLKGVNAEDLKSDEEAKVNSAKALLKENKGAITEINFGSASADAIFAANSLYINKNAIVYLDSQYGLILYDYSKLNDANANDGRIRLFNDEKLAKATVKFWQDGYLYVTGEDGNYMRVNLATLVNMETGAVIENGTSKVEKVNYIASAGDWYIPEIINGAFLSVYTAEPYGSLVYAQDIAKVASLTEDEIKELTESKKANVLANLETSISLRTEAKQEAIDKYLKDNFKDEK